MDSTTTTCPKCGKSLALRAGEGVRDLGDTANTYEQCLRECPACDIRLSNSETNPTFIRRDFADGLWRRDGAASLLRICRHALNVRSREKKQNSLAHEKSEDLLTWNFFSWLEDEGALPRVLACLDLPPQATKIGYWGTHDRHPRRFSELASLLADPFGENPVALSEPDVILVSDHALVFIEVKFTSPNDRRAEANWAPYVNAAGGACFTSPEAAKATGLYELVRNWAIGCRWASGKPKRQFTLVNLVREKDETGIEAEFVPCLNQDAGRFVRVSWEHLVRTVAPGLIPRFKELTVNFRPAFPDL